MEKIIGGYSYIFFPFLKMTGKIVIGKYTFSSTDDTEGLSIEQAKYVREISEMIFLQDNLRIKSSSYAIVPFLDLHIDSADLDYLVYLQAVVAYCYAFPRHEFGDIFLSPEHASMAILTPCQVMESLVCPDYHVELIGHSSELNVVKHGRIAGYAGLYNFQHYFWVAKGSRLYGPQHHLTLNHSQNLSHDLIRAAKGRADYSLLLKLLDKSFTQLPLRAFAAVRWFNEANKEANNKFSAIVNLSIAFEALFELPRDNKTNRLIDAVSLLLGRTPRLADWVEQFYAARSEIVHKGHAQQLRFVVAKASPYSSLLSYGRQIFQLCLATLLTGAELAEKLDLEEKLITNQERFQNLCKILSDSTKDSSERISCIIPIITAIKQYRYVQENFLEIKTLINSIKLASKVLLEQKDRLSQDIIEQLEHLLKTQTTKDHLPELDVLNDMKNIFEKKSDMIDMEYFFPFRDLVDIVWGYVFTHYYWMKENS